jgi:hypothetical protein
LGEASTTSATGTLLPRVFVTEEGDTSSAIGIRRGFDFLLRVTLDSKTGIASASTMLMVFFFPNLDLEINVLALLLDRLVDLFGGMVILYAYNFTDKMQRLSVYLNYYFGI